MWVEMKTSIRLKSEVAGQDGVKHVTLVRGHWHHYEGQRPITANLTRKKTPSF